MSSSPSLISLFTGAGGLDLGLEQAGFETLLANEIEPHACETLRQNQTLSRIGRRKFEEWFSDQLTQKCYKWSSKDSVAELHERLKSGIGDRTYLKNATILQQDVRTVSGSQLLEATGKRRGEIELIAGGPPCQPFSRAGKRESVKADTGRLFKDFVRLVAETRPRWFLFENVKGLTITKAPILQLYCHACAQITVGSFSDWEACEREQSHTAYCPKCKGATTTSFVTKAGGSLDIILEEFSRIGYRCRHRILNAADFGAPQTRDRLFILGSRDNEDFDWPLPTHSRSGALGRDTLFDVGDLKPWVGIKEALWSKGHWKYGKLDERSVLWVKNVVRPHDEPVTWELSRPSPTIGAHQSAKLAVAPFGVPEEQLARQQWHTLGRRQGDTPPVFVEHEYLTDGELLKLQTFPNNWYLYGTRMERAFQIGNAVPPSLAFAVGTALLTAMGLARPCVDKPRAQLAV